MCAISQGVPGWAALLIFLVVLFLLGVMEGIQVRLQCCLSNHKTVQIALVELKRQDPETYKESHPRAYRWMIPEKSILRLCRIPSSCNTQAWSNCRQGRQHRKIPLGSPGCRHRHHCRHPPPVLYNAIKVFVVCLVFFAAKLTTIHGRDDDGFLFPVPGFVQV